jgi:hypothetical protein
MAEFQYKVTKYDPSRYGGPGGGYTADEWTAFSDVGKSFNGVVLAEEEYLRVEELYLSAVRVAAEVSGVSRLQVRDLEGEGDLTDLRWVELPEALEIIRGMLRESGVWCTLSDGERFYAHVGNDYYLYIGTPVDVRPAWAELENQGLFVEENWPSPYLDD